jgi:hypothetical protein
VSSLSVLSIFGSWKRPLLLVGLQVWSNLLFFVA